MDENSERKEFLPMEKMDAILEEVWDMCLATEAHNDESLAKIIGYNLAGEGHAMVCLPEFPESAEDKRHIMRTIGLQLGLHEKLNCVCFFFLTEAWIAQYENTAMLDEHHIRASECPDRKEVLIMTACGIGGTQALRVAEIVRRPGEERDLVEDARMATHFSDEEEHKGIQSGSHLLPELVKSYSMAVMARREPALRAQIESILEDASAQLVTPEDLGFNV